MFAEDSGRLLNKLNHLEAEKNHLQGKLGDRPETLSSTTEKVNLNIYANVIN